MVGNKGCGRFTVIRAVDGEQQAKVLAFGELFFAHEQYGRCRVLKHAAGNRTQEEALNGGKTARPHGNQVNIVVDCDFGDSWSAVVNTHRHMRFNAVGLDFRREFLNNRLAFSFINGPNGFQTEMLNHRSRNVLLHIEQRYVRFFAHELRAGANKANSCAAACASVYRNQNPHFHSFEKLCFFKASLSLIDSISTGSFRPIFVAPLSCLSVLIGCFTMM